MAVGSRHIRHDFNTWVDWEQKSVRSVCGSTTKRHLAGVPGVTPQRQIVELPDRKVWGWCMRCVNGAWSPIDNNANADDIDPRIKELYIEAREAIKEQRLWYEGKMLRERELRRLAREREKE